MTTVKTKWQRCWWRFWQQQHQQVQQQLWEWQRNQQRLWVPRMTKKLTTKKGTNISTIPKLVSYTHPDYNKLLKHLTNEVNNNEGVVVPPLNACYWWWHDSHQSLFSLWASGAHEKKWMQCCMTSEIFALNKKGWKETSCILQQCKCWKALNSAMLSCAMNQQKQRSINLLFRPL